MNVSRQVRRQEQRTASRNLWKFTKPRKQNPTRAKILRGMSIAIANAMTPPDIMKWASQADRVNYQAEQRHLANELNQEFIERSRGKSGKKPSRTYYIKSIAMQTIRTNQIGHFA